MAFGLSRFEDFGCIKKFCNVGLILILVGVYGVANALAQPTPSRPRSGFTIRSLVRANGNPVRLSHDATTGDLYYLSMNGDVYKLQPPYSQQSLVYSSLHHGLTGQVLGMEIGPDGSIYLVDNQVTGALTKGIIKKGTRSQNGSTIWTILAQTVPYPRSATPFDHNVNGLAISPDGSFLYLNSGSRTDHGEEQNNNNQFPGLRESPITSAILRIPTNAQNVTIPNNEAALLAGGFLFADGTRNSFDLAFSPAGDLFGTENAGDRDDSEELNWLREGHHYGFPWRIGTNMTPMQFSTYNPSSDLLLNANSFAVQGGFFRNDPQYPAPPSGIVFTEPVRNLGPDARHYRDPVIGSIKEGTDTSFFGTFTTHRSPLGLVFDQAGTLPEPYRGDGFVLSWTGANDSKLLAPFGEEGEDLLHLDLQKVGESYEARVTQIFKGFVNPIDAVLTAGKLYVLEFGGNKNIWEITFPVNSSVEEEIPLKPVSLSIYPNPSTGVASLQIDAVETQLVRIGVFDILGRQVANIGEKLIDSSSPNVVQIVLGDLPTGVYSIHVIGTSTPHMSRLLMHVRGRQ